MKWQTIVRRIAIVGVSPAGVPGVAATLKSQATNQVLRSGLTDGNGVATFTLDGSPGPTRLEVQNADVLRYQASEVRGPDGPANIAELPLVLNSLQGVLPEQGHQFAVAPGAGRSVTVGPGACVIPGGFVYKQYGSQTVEIAGNQSAVTRYDYVVAEADDDESSATYGRTRLAVTQSAPAASVVLAIVSVRTGASSITAADINTAQTPRSLVGFAQSTPVWSSVTEDMPGSSVFAGTSYTAPVRVVSGFQQDIAYDMTATVTMLACLTTTSSNTQTVTATLTSGASSATRSATYNQANVNFPAHQMLSATVAWTHTIPVSASPGGSVTISGSYATSGTTGRVMGYTYDLVAVPRR